jgi:hypothetical protein
MGTMNVYSITYAKVNNMGAPTCYRTISNAASGSSAASA